MLIDSSSPIAALSLSFLQISNSGIWVHIYLSMIIGKWKRSIKEWVSSSSSYLYAIYRILWKLIRKLCNNYSSTFILDVKQQQSIDFIQLLLYWMGISDRKSRPILLSFDKLVQKDCTNPSKNMIFIYVYQTSFVLILFVMKQLAVLCLLFLFIIESMAQFVTVVDPNKNYTSVPPTWLTSPYFRAGSQAVITTLTGNTLTPVFTFTFSSPLTGIPNLAYGIKNYRGNDYFGQEYYEIKMIGLTQATFTVQIQIYGVTNIWLLAVAYLAVEPTFPHHFNTFDNVPLNYSSGDLVNISARSTTSLTYFTEYINYTQQAAARTFKTFTYPLSSNIIVLFMTSLWIQGTFGERLQFHITPTVVSTQIYKLNATLLTNAKITNVHFSQVIFNTVDIESSNQYQVVYYQWDNDMNGGWRSLPSEFVDNFIMGVTAFETVDAYCGFQYQWEFANQSGVFGVEVLLSWTLTNTCGFSWSQTSVLYISTWLCTSPYIYFNISTQLCQDSCGGYFLQNPSAASCVQCTNPMCYTCDPNNRTYCLQCAAYDHMQLINGNCQCYSGYFYLTGKCVACSTQNPGCLDCAYSEVSTILPFNSSDFQCNSCNQGQNYFLVNSFCVQCSIPHCTICSSLTTCQQCASSYSVDYSFTCSQCAVLGCFECLPGDNNLCLNCYNAGGFFIVPATQMCTSICGDAITAIGMEACDDGNTIAGDGCSSTCTIQPFFNCTILANLTTVCSPVCGDGVQNGGQACDDGNLINGDGCNYICQIQIVVTLQSQIRNLDFCNNLKFGFTTKPYQTFMDTFNFTSLIMINSTSLINPTFSYNAYKLTLSYDFNKDMVMEVLQVSYNTSLMLEYKNYTFIFTPNIFKVDPENNVAANYLEQQMCNLKKFYEKSYKAIEIASYITLFLTLLPGKIIGLELMGVLQLAYFSLGSIDSVNILLSPLMNMNGLNGYSKPLLGSTNGEIPRRVKQIHHYPTFLDNFNVMFLLMFLELIIGAIIYIFTKISGSTSKILVKMANRLLKQVFLTLILFNCFNISYSFAIYFRYSGEHLDPMNIVTSIMSIAALLLMSFMITYASPEGFGEFKQKFKDGPVEKSYMTVSVLYRSTIGFLLAFSNDDDLSTLFALGISLLFLLYNLVNLPFTKAYHNYRACLCHLTQFITLFVAMYYRSMKSTTSPAIVASIYSPAEIEFYLLIICLFVSVLVLCYDSYLYIKEFCRADKIETEQNQLNPVEVSKEHVMINEDFYETCNDISLANSNTKQSS